MFIYLCFPGENTVATPRPAEQLNVPENSHAFGILAVRLSGRSGVGVNIRRRISPNTPTDKRTSGAGSISSPAQFSLRPWSRGRPLLFLTRHGYLYHAELAARHAGGLTLCLYEGEDRFAAVPVRPLLRKTILPSAPRRVGELHQERVNYNSQQHPPHLRKNPQSPPRPKTNEHPHPRNITRHPPPPPQPPHRRPRRPLANTGRKWHSTRCSAP